MVKKNIKNDFLKKSSIDILLSFRRIMAASKSFTPFNAAIKIINENGDLPQSENMVLEIGDFRVTVRKGTKSPNLRHDVRDVNNPGVKWVNFPKFLEAVKERYVKGPEKEASLELQKELYSQNEELLRSMAILQGTVNDLVFLVRRLYTAQEQPLKAEQVQEAAAQEQVQEAAEPWSELNKREEVEEVE